MYADQTSGNDAIDNFGGWANCGLTGSGTVASGDTGPNVFATIGVVQWVIANLNGDASRVYPFGFSLGAIGVEYLMLKYNQVTGNPKIFTAGMSVAGVLEINNYGGPTSVDYSAMQNVPCIWVSGAGDNLSKPGDWNDRMWRQYAGNSSYPAPGTDLVTGSRAGSSLMRYWRNPNTGHQQDDGRGNDYPANAQILDWIFSQIGNVSSTMSTVPDNSESPSGTLITSIGPTITDRLANTWAIGYYPASNAGSQVVHNGSVDTTTANVAALGYFNHIVYHQNTSGNWYSWAGSGWAAAPDPR